MKKRYVLISLLILALVGYFIWDYLRRQSEERVLKASGTIETTEIQVGSQIGGRIRGVMFEEGDFVKSGDVLVQLDPYQIPAQRRELQAQLAQAQARLEELERGPRPQEIAAAEARYREARERANLVAAGARSEEVAQAEANLRQAEADLQNARQNLQRMQALFDRRVISQQELDTAQTTFNVAQERVNASNQRLLELRRGSRPQEVAAAREQARAQRQQLELLRAGSRAEDIAAQRAAVRGIQAQLQQLEEVEDELFVRSPCHCQISAMDLQPGQLIGPNQTVATLIDLDDLWVRVYIPEERFGQVKPGDKAGVKVDPYPKRTFDGTVVQLASRAEFTPRNVQTEETRKLQVFGVKVALDNRERLLRPGMPADVYFDLTQPQPRSGRM